ncbi:MAG: hypothetical protein JW958_04445 [Candidatus Eisenbacteria bacterium]|nr:hypothetical protein [Candidatus Eisenbacteria bacterium]
MRRRRALAWLIVTALPIAGCGGGDDGPTGGGGDTTGPAAVADLSAASAGDSSITLVWTTPADPAKTFDVSRYDLRYSSATITTGNWDTADTLSGEPIPGAPGEPETLTVAGLDLGASYFFALRSEDAAGNLSDLSNPLAAATDSIDDRLIAYYPLVENAGDVTGFHGPMSLYNTPFQEAGIYCNGVYLDGINEGGCHAGTTIDSLDFAAFTISARFKPAAAGPGSHPVFVGGDLWRWMSFRLEPDSTVSLMVNGGVVQRSSARYTPGAWHEGRITYDGQTARLYLDDGLACERDAVLDHGNDRGLGISNSSHGTVFQGIFGRMKIYDGVVAP